MLTKTRLLKALPTQFIYCPTCRDECDAPTDARDDDEPLRCLTCGDQLELAEKTVTALPTDTVDMAAICEEEGLPPGALKFNRLTCTAYHVIDEAAANLH
jgi:hypothetical protein